MRATLFLFVAGLTATACYPVNNEDAFASSSAKAGCRALQKCSLAGFLEEYRDMADCVDERTDDNEEFNEIADDRGCDYDEDEAKNCIDALLEYASTCEDADDIADECEKVWDDCD